MSSTNPPSVKVLVRGSAHLNRNFGLGDMPAAVPVCSINGFSEPGEANVIKRLLLGLASAALVSGCSTLPNFSGWPTKPDEVVGPTVDDIVNHVQCEIVALLVIDLKDTALNLSPEDRKALSDFRTYHYLMTGTLTLEVVDTQSFSPSLGVVEPFLRAGTSRIVLLGGSYTGTQRRIMTLGFTLDLEPEKARAAANNQCKGFKPGRSTIKGDLGLREIILSGVKSADGFFFQSTPKVDDKKQPIPNPVRPGFGSTVEFTIARSIGGGPTFTLTYFRVTGNLLSAGKTNKDSLVVSFASAGVRDKKAGDGELESTKRRPGEPSNVDQAVREAQDQLQRMILQRLVPQ